MLTSSLAASHAHAHGACACACAYSADAYACFRYAYSADAYACFRHTHAHTAQTHTHMLQVYSLGVAAGSSSCVGMAAALLQLCCRSVAARVRALAWLRLCCSSVADLLRLEFVRWLGCQTRGSPLSAAAAAACSSCRRGAQHTSAYVCMRRRMLERNPSLCCCCRRMLVLSGAQHTSAYVCIRTVFAACSSCRIQTYADVCCAPYSPHARPAGRAAYVSIRLHTRRIPVECSLCRQSTCIRQRMSTYGSACIRDVC
jgi:hypothetical protein